jgi:hypothetical protein
MSHSGESSNSLAAVTVSSGLAAARSTSSTRQAVTSHAVGYSLLIGYDTEYLWFGPHRLLLIDYYFRYVGMR